MSNSCNKQTKTTIKSTNGVEVAVTTHLHIALHQMHQLYQPPQHNICVTMVVVKWKRWWWCCSDQAELLFSIPRWRIWVAEFFSRWRWWWLQPIVEFPWWEMRRRWWCNDVVLTLVWIGWLGNLTRFSRLKWWQSPIIHHTSRLSARALMQSYINTILH